MSIQTRQQLADYCLRSLGAPVINIEVDNDQLADRIEDAISYFHEYHFDAIERDFYVHKITGSTITVADATGFAVGDTISSIDDVTTTAQIASISSNVITINRQIGYEKFQVNQSIKKKGTGPQTTITNIVLGDIDNGWVPAGENIVGVKKILNITNILGSGDYIFNAQYQIMMSEIQNLTAGSISYFYGVQQYLGHLDFIMKKEKDFRFNRRMNRLYLDISWGVDVKVGDIVVADIYRALDDAEFPEMLNDIWLKRYSTALIKRQWASGLKKYTGVQLPGGLTYNGQQIFDEAVGEIQRLENEAIFSASPLDFYCG